MQYTSAQAAKLLAKLQQDHEQLAAHEDSSKFFLVSIGEDAESVRPPYDYAETQRQLQDLEQKIRQVKHALNVFNTVTVIPEFGITIDQMLIYIPQLSKQKSKLMSMANALPKKREVSGLRVNIIDYQHANFDIEQAKRDLDEVTETLSKAQLALDTVNHSEQYTLALDL